jgi:hypothetical protein
MTKNHFRILLVFLLCFVVQHAYGELPLAQLTYGHAEGSADGGGELPTTILFYFSMGGTGGGGEWSRDVAEAELGQAFRPDATNLSRMISSWHATDLAASFRVGFNDFGQGVPDLDGVFAGTVPPINFTVESFVPTTPTAYDLSDVTITVTNWQVGRMPGGIVFYSGNMTVRFYAIPEASTLVLASFALCFLVNHRSRR